METGYIIAIIIVLVLVILYFTFPEAFTRVKNFVSFPFTLAYIRLMTFLDPNNTEKYEPRYMSGTSGGGLANYQVNDSSYFPSSESMNIGSYKSCNGGAESMMIPPVSVAVNEEGMMVPPMSMATEEHAAGEPDAAVNAGKFMLGENESSGMMIPTDANISKMIGDQARTKYLQANCEYNSPLELSEPDPFNPDSN